MSSGFNPSTAGLAAGDLEPRVYEGGFKTWECSVDLAKYLGRALAGGQLELAGKELQIIEVGSLQSQSNIAKGYQARSWDSYTIVFALVSSAFAIQLEGTACGPAYFSGLQF